MLIIYFFLMVATPEPQAMVHAVLQKLSSNLKEEVWNVQPESFRIGSGGMLRQDIMKRELDGDNRNYSDL